MWETSKREQQPSVRVWVWDCTTPSLYCTGSQYPANSTIWGRRGGAERTVGGNQGAGGQHASRGARGPEDASTDLSAQLNVEIVERGLDRAVGPTGSLSGAGRIASR